MAKTKLLMTINCLKKGGAERVITTLSNSLYQRNFDITFVCLNYTEQCYPLADGIKVIYLVKDRKRFPLARLYYLAATFFRMFNVIAKEKPDCTIAFMTSASIWAGLSCMWLKLPYIVSERTTPEITIAKLNIFSRWLSFFVFKHSKVIVSPSKGVEDCLKNILTFNKLKNYVVINNPVNQIQEVKTAQVHYRRYVLAVGRLMPEKGFDFLIESFAQLQQQDVDLIILGEGPERTRLESLVESLGLSHRVFLPGLKNNLWNYYKEAQAFVLSSRTEGYPNVLIEAMNMGCACIAADCHWGPREIINDGVNGILIEKENRPQLIDALERILTQPELRSALSANAMVISKSNSLDAISDQWEEVILSPIISNIK